MTKAETPYRKRQQKLREMILQYIEQHRGFSVFWATETNERARMLVKLEKEGAISRKRGKGWGRYPWCGYKRNAVSEKAET